MRLHCSCNSLLMPALTSDPASGQVQYLWSSTCLQGAEDMQAISRAEHKFVQAAVKPMLKAAQEQGAEAAFQRLLLEEEAAAAQAPQQAKQQAAKKAAKKARQKQRKRVSHCSLQLLLMPSLAVPVVFSGDAACPAYSCWLEDPQALALKSSTPIRISAPIDLQRRPHTTVLPCVTPSARMACVLRRKPVRRRRQGLRSLQPHLALHLQLSHHSSPTSQHPPSLQTSNPRARMQRSCMC